MIQTRGFTLIECVVALAIVAVSFATLYETLAASLRRNQRTSDQALALLHLASLADRAGIDHAWVEGTTEGALEAPFRWRLTATRTSVPAAETETLWDVTLTVEWARDGETRSVSTRRRELGGTPP